MNTIAQKCLKVPLALNGLLKSNGTGGFYYLIYHSVSNRLKLELDLPLTTFRRQLEFLAQTKRVIPYDQALDRLQSGGPQGQEAFVLTFDDGYVDFYTHVFPLLRQLELPVILFVTTGFIETGIPYPILPRQNTTVRPVTWEMLGEMVGTGLVTLGAHTHTHPDLVVKAKQQVIEELVRPIELIQQRLGLTVQHFAYPKALWSEAIEASVAQYYASAVIGGGQRTTPIDFNPYRIPRIPIRRSDGWLFFRAKIRGWLESEETLYSKLRQVRRRNPIK